AKGPVEVAGRPQLDRRRDTILQHLDHKVGCFDVGRIVGFRSIPAPAAATTGGSLVVLVERLPQPVTPRRALLAEQVAAVDKQPRRPAAPQTVDPLVAEDLGLTGAVF